MQTHEEPALGWTRILRRQPVHLVEGRPEGGCTDARELICGDCGDDPDLDYRDIPAGLHRIRGRYRFSAGIEACGQHDRVRHGQPPVRAASETQKQTRSADGKTG